MSTGAHADSDPAPPRSESHASTSTSATSHSRSTDAPRPASLTARNLGRIPDADEVAPGIRLPGPDEDDRERRGKGTLGQQRNVYLTHREQRRSPHDDDDDHSESGKESLRSDGTPLGSELGADHAAYVGHYGEGGAPVAGVPPELDPRTSTYRPPSPGAASVFSVAVQPPGSPKMSPLDMLNDANVLYETTEPLSSPALEATTAGLSSMGLGGVPPIEMVRRSSAAALSVSGATAGSSGSRPPSPSIVSRAGTQAYGSSPPSHAMLSMLGLGAGSGGAQQRGRSALGAVVSQAPSEYGSCSSEGGNDAPLDRHSGRAQDDDAASSSHRSTASGAIGGGGGGSGSTRGGGRGGAPRDEAHIEALRMREREVAGGEAGVGGLASASNRPLFAPGLAALRNTDARRAGSTAATVGTSSPTPSLGGVSEPPDALDGAPSRRGSSGSAVTLASLIRPASRAHSVGDHEGSDAGIEHDKPRGALIVVEGLDRAGKSTQVERLVQELDARLVKFPDRTTPIGKMLDSYLQQKSDMDDRAVHLLFSANRWELAPSIRADLEAGKTVVCDRYAFSGIAYSVAKGLPFDWCLSCDASLPAPDLTLFLTLSPAAAAQRGGYGAERYENEPLQARVKAAFEDIEARVRDWKTVDADKSEDEVWEQVREAATKAVGLTRGGVRRLFA